jgi:alkylation response protein AidB-like acyl-CoA dehydrogenase
MDFSLSTDQEAFVASARAFGRDRVGPRASEIDRTGIYPRALVTEAGALGLLAVTLPQRWGGAGRDYVSYALARRSL